MRKKSKDIEKLPERTVERLSEYRRTLLRLDGHGLGHIYSHELAEKQAITAVQVRRDLMLIGFASIGKRGYNIRELIDHIGITLDSPNQRNVAVVGMGHLAQAIARYFGGKSSLLKIVASFDTDPKKVGQCIGGIKCYHTDSMKEIITQQNINILLLTLPTSAADTVSSIIATTDIRGVLNFTSATLNLPDNIYIEDYDMVTLLEKVAYFSK